VSDTAAQLRRELRGIFQQRRFLLIGGAVSEQLRLGRELCALGAERPFLLGQGSGAGVLPAAGEADWHALDVSGADRLAEARAYEAALRQPPFEVLVALDTWDPEYRALAVGPGVLGDLRSVAGRARYARRLPHWLRLEDKTRLHRFLSALGIEGGPHAVVRARPADLSNAAMHLDEGSGTVWSGDTSEGPHGGATRVRWVRTAQQARAAGDFFARHCRAVRVMPFVEGVPCSIHGLVLPRGVAVFRPVELVVLRRPDVFEYAGAATYWDPDPADRHAMRELARCVGEGLRVRSAYRGAYTVDGVLGAHGFVPTEINTRIGAAFHLLAPELPLAPLALAAAEGETLDCDPAELEACVLEAADAERGGGLTVAVTGAPAQPLRHALVETADGFRLAQDGELEAATVVVGSSHGAGWLSVRPNARRTAIGPAFAPRAVRALALAESLCGVHVGPLEAARPVPRLT